MVPCTAQIRSIHYTGPLKSVPKQVLFLALEDWTKLVREKNIPGLKMFLLAVYAEAVLHLAYGLCR